MSGGEASDALYDAAERLCDVFVQRVGEKFQCVLDQRCFSTKAIATAHLYKSHAQNLRELMPEDSAVVHMEGATAVGEETEPADAMQHQPQSQAEADELVALQLALDEYEAQQQQEDEAQRGVQRQRAMGQRGASSQPHAQTQLQRTPSSASKRGHHGAQKPLTKQERLVSLLSKTEDILQTVQRAIDRQQAEQQPKPQTQQQAASSSSALPSTHHHPGGSKNIQQPLLLTGGTLHEFQIAGMSWLCSLHRCGLNGILADEMGLGKTVQVIGFLAALAEQFHIVGPHLVVVPLSVLRSWKDALHRWCPAAAVMVYHGPKDERFAAFKAFVHNLNDESINSPSIVLTSYEIALKDVNILRRVPRRWAYLIVDEAHRLKNWNSKLVQALRTLQPRRRLLLTGTPLQNNLGELWSLLNFLLPSIFDDVYNFLEWFNAPFDFEQSTSSTDAALTDEEQTVIIERLHSVLQPFLLRRMKTDVSLPLPSKVERVIHCPLSPLQAALYQKIRDRTCLEQSISYLNVMMQLRKLCNHPFLVLGRQAIDEELWQNYLIKASGKLAVLHQLLRILLSQHHKILIFTQFASMLDILEELLVQQGIGHFRIDGQCHAAERADRLHLFNNDTEHRYPVFLISTRAGGVGLNLQSADTVIIFDSDWNPQMDLQAQDRAHRLGQTKDVLVLRLVSLGPTSEIASVEEVLLKRAQHKLKAGSQILASGQFAGDKTGLSFAALFETKSDVPTDGNDSEGVTIQSVAGCATQLADVCTRPSNPDNSQFHDAIIWPDPSSVLMVENELEAWAAHLHEAKEGKDNKPVTEQRRRTAVNYSEEEKQLRVQRDKAPTTAPASRRITHPPDGPVMPVFAESTTEGTSLATESLAAGDNQTFEASSRYSLESDDASPVCAMCGQADSDDSDDDFDESAPFKFAPDEDWGVNTLSLPEDFDCDLLDMAAQQTPKIRRGVLLLCDGCNSAFHLSCVDLTSVPPGDWFCDWCAQQMQRR